jgi:hypothetical protein
VQTSGTEEKGQGQKRVLLGTYVENEESSRINAAGFGREIWSKFRREIIHFTPKLGGHVLTLFSGTCQSSGLAVGGEWDGVGLK